MACAARQLTALIGQDSKVGWVPSAVVLSVMLRQARTRPFEHAATRSVRPSESKSVARIPETCWTDRRHLNGNFVELAETVVEHGNRRRLVRGQYQVEVTVVVDVEQRRYRCEPVPAAERVGLRPWREDRCQALGDEALP